MLHPASTALAATWALALLFAPVSQAQFPPPITPDSNLTTILSPVNGNISITYKSPPPGTCTTVFPNQKQYTGHVQLPPYTLAPVQQNYSINTFFWFVEARESPETAPLTIWLNGGPGGSSMMGMFQENGPCEVVELGLNEWGTKARDWGWDRSSNMLYVDQPNQVGFSYDIPTNVSLDLLRNNYVEPPTQLPSGAQPYAFLNGTFGSMQNYTTANTTEIAAYSIWHMLQGFLGSFPQYNPGFRIDTNETSPAGVNLFAESYGGKYGPGFASVWEEQNMRRMNGSLPQNGTLEIQLQALGIVNGCIDDLIQAPFYPYMAYNNSYGIKAISASAAQNALDSFSAPGGCRDAILACRKAVAEQDPNNDGNVPDVNDLCIDAEAICQTNVTDPYTVSNRGQYDIRHMNPDPFPPGEYREYLNQGNFLAAIGARTNYSEVSNFVNGVFITTGDPERGDQISQLAYLLSKGVRVALIYGDADYICNWYGGQAASFAVAQASNYTPFYNAGYADIQVNQSYIGGAVRQYGNLSFSRVYDAGHLVPAYQPETAFTVFTRIIQGTNIATGETVNLTNFGTTGNANATHTNKAGPAPSPTCWIRAIEDTCTDQQKVMIMNGQGVVINGVLYDKASDWSSPASTATSNVGVPGSYPTTKTETSVVTQTASATVTSSMPTGVYVASGTSSNGMKNGSFSLAPGWALLGSLVLMLSMSFYGI
ncbi:alpha/beta-hydrolase [Xylona heveae TC161]|uniref:Carboxypeptidase n=1 Tax=Xylona heveae (strain CBS 132557 / TC161) TaxID=1328760 RepID=A0A165IHH8_XYLHT|nr:alpha/beta-hydrolase [Xylona heveae TC161]KZF24904.1 alpha/beta-hydrolase [Xylona heveae TC161]